MNAEKFFSVNWSLSVVNLAAVFIAATYVFGYLIHGVFRATLGLNTRGLLEAEYLETGFFFEILSLAIVAIPVVVWLLLRGLSPTVLPPPGDGNPATSRTAESMKSNRNVKLPFCLISNFCYVTLFFALFLTKEYLASSVSLFGYSFRFAFVSLGYFFGGIVLFLILGLVRLALKEEGGTTTKALLKILRFISLVFLIGISAGVDLILIFEVPLLRRVLLSASLYLGLLVLLCCIASYAIFRLRHLGDPVTRFLMLGMASFFGFIIVYFIVLTYGFSMYPSIPANRGGRYPLTQVTFVINKQSKDQYRDLIGWETPAEVRTIPLFLLDKDDHLFFTAKVCGPFQDWMRDVHVIKKDEIVRMDITRNTLIGDVSADLADAKQPHS